MFKISFYRNKLMALLFTFTVTASHQIFAASTSTDIKYMLKDLHDQFSTSVFNLNSALRKNDQQQIRLEAVSVVANYQHISLTIKSEKFLSEANWIDLKEAAFLLGYTTREFSKLQRSKKIIHTDVLQPLYQRIFNSKLAVYKQPQNKSDEEWKAFAKKIRLKKPSVLKNFKYNKKEWSKDDQKIFRLACYELYEIYIKRYNEQI